MANTTIRKGDHLWVRCAGYAHHGIANGPYTVIHYAGKRGVYENGIITETTLDDFSNGAEIHIKDHPGRKHSRDASVRRATQRIGEAQYNVVFNNCEHFVAWCIEDEHTSEQINAVFRESGKSMASLYALGTYRSWSAAQTGDVVYRAASMIGSVASSLGNASSVATGSRLAVAAGVVGGVAAAPVLIPIAVGTAVVTGVYAGWKALFGD